MGALATAGPFSPLSRTERQRVRRRLRRYSPLRRRRAEGPSDGSAPADGCPMAPDEQAR